MRLVSTRLVVGIAALCLCCLLFVALFRCFSGPGLVEPYKSPLAKIATGSGVPDIGITLAIASNTDLEPLVQRLYSKGWPRTAARLARLQPQKKCWVFMNVALENGDGELFWATRPPEESPDNYWARNVPPWCGGERRYNLLKWWPANDASAQRLMHWPFYLAFRPVAQTGADFLAAVKGILPCPFAAGLTFMEPLMEGSALNSLFSAVILPEVTTTEDQILGNIGILGACGFKWGAVRTLARRLPRARLPRLLKTAILQGDDALMIEIVNKSDVPADIFICDMLVSLLPETLARIAGDARRPLLIRHHALPGIAAMIGSEAALILDESWQTETMKGRNVIGQDGFRPPPESGNGGI